MKGIALQKLDVFTACSFNDVKHDAIDDMLSWHDYIHVCNVLYVFHVEGFHVVWCRLPFLRPPPMALVELRQLKGCFSTMFLSMAPGLSIRRLLWVNPNCGSTIWYIVRPPFALQLILPVTGKRCRHYVLHLATVVPRNSPMVFILVALLCWYQCSI